MCFFLNQICFSIICSMLSLKDLAHFQRQGCSVLLVDVAHSICSVAFKLIILIGQSLAGNVRLHDFEKTKFLPHISQHFLI